jgi:hypothetical protein
VHGLTWLKSSNVVRARRVLLVGVGRPRDEEVSDGGCNVFSPADRDRPIEPA